MQALIALQLLMNPSNFKFFLSIGLTITLGFIFIVHDSFYFRQEKIFSNFPDENLENFLNSGNSGNSKNCSPKSNIVFLKTHKCASSAIQNIFLRYAFDHDLILVLPPRKNYLGHPLKFRRQMALPPPKKFRNGTKADRKFNIFTFHTRFDYDQISSIMPNETIWVTIIR